MINEILKNIQIENLNEMQNAALKATSKQVMIFSPTGSGKTVAFLLPLIQRLRKDINGVQAVIIAPSRELTLQIDSVIKSMRTPFTSVAVYGGRAAMDEHRTIKSLNPTIIIGTPGRLNDHLKKGNFSTVVASNLIIDEFDKCLELGFMKEMTEVLQQLDKVEYRMLTSATQLNSEEQEREAKKDFARLNALLGGMHSYKVLNFLEDSTERDARINVYKVDSPEKDKLNTLFNLLCQLGEQQSIVFVNYRESVERTAKFLKQQGIFCEYFHGGMDQDLRERALYRFRNGSCNVFVSTDLAARGLDIEAVDNVIHYHLPLNAEAFVHRNGRTARWDKTGNAYIIVGPEETALNEWQASDFELKVGEFTVSTPKWITIYIGRGKKDKLNKVDIVGFLCKQGGLQKDEIGQIDVMAHHSYVAVARKKAKQMLSNTSGLKIKNQKTIIEISK